MLISGFMGAAVGFTLGSDTSCDGRMCGAVDTAVGVTLGSISSSSGRVNRVVGATDGVTLGCDVPFDISDISLGNWSGATR